MSHNPHSLDSERLTDAFLAAKTSDQMRALIHDILTKNEIKRCVQRLFVAYKLLSGASYEFLEHSSGLSSTTIARIAKQLKNRDGGYNIINSRLYPDSFGSWDGPDYALEELKKELEEERSGRS